MEAEDWKAKDLEKGDSKAEDLGNEYSVSNFSGLKGRVEDLYFRYLIFHLAY